MSNWVLGRVERVVHWDRKAFSLFIHADIAPFLAGQFVKLGLMEGESRIHRPFSLVNSPAQRLLEVYIIAVERGRLSPRLQRLQAGETVWVSGSAYGHFTRERLPVSEALWLFATGSGISPYLSMLQAGIPLELAPRIVLVHAVRYTADRRYAGCISQLIEAYAGRLRFQSIVSREAAPEAVQGRIPALLASGELVRLTGEPLSAASSHVMLCGNPEMIQETQKILMQRWGFKKHTPRCAGQITTEFYW